MTDDAAMTTSVYTRTRATVCSFKEGNTCFVILNATLFLRFKKLLKFQSIFDCITDLIVKQKKCPFLTKLGQ